MKVSIISVYGINSYYYPGFRSRVGRTGRL